jgi:alpha-ketoglutaric semialdehyde dehydrogenase
MQFKPNHPEIAKLGSTLAGSNWIGGKEREGQSGSFEAKSAVDHRDVVGVFPESSVKDVEQAAKAAADAFTKWKSTPAPIRGAIIGRIGRIIEEQKEKLAKVITREIGKTPREAMGEVQEAIDTCQFFQSEGRRLYGQTVPSEMHRKELFTYRRPIGVVGMITAGNFPMAVPSWKIIPAILCGNTVVWKPSEDAPTIAYLFMRAMVDAGLPAGVVNVVNGKGAGGAGQFMIEGIDQGYFQKFSFTGSTVVGRLIGEACGRQLQIPSLELGGKNPMIVMEDADIENAVSGALWAAYGTAGQRCTSLGNLILHEPIAKRFKQAFMDGLAKMEMGNPIEHPGITYGPMMNARFGQRFLEHFEMGKKDGATLLSGGSAWTESNRDARVKGTIAHGTYMQPALWDGVSKDMQLFQNETFGPTVNLVTVKDFDEAMACANGTPYGLSSSIYTQNRSWIESFKSSISAGMSSINNSTTGAEAHLPFGGNGWSGNGTRESGVWVVDAYTKWHAVNDDASGKLQLAQIETNYGEAPSEKTDWSKL